MRLIDVRRLAVINASRQRIARNALTGKALTPAQMTTNQTLANMGGNDVLALAKYNS